EKGKIITEDFLKDEVELEYFPDNRTFRISDERLSALRKDGKEKKSRLPFIEKDKEGKVFHLREEYPGHPFYYEVGRDHTLVSLPLFEPDFPHISALKMEMERIIISRENSSYNVVQLESRIIELAGNELLFKDFVSGLSGLFPEVKGLRIEKDNSESKLIIQFNNFDLNLQSVSRGIINLIYILLLIFENHSSILILDEPEIGLDFEVLPRLAEFIRWFVKKWGNQMIIATKSPQFAEIFSDDEIVIINNSGRGSEITAMPLAGPLFRREEIIKLIRKQV
ncbi:MAG: AAA family ATPase, partial [Vulcanimicrobiota bacterium]